MEIVLIGAHGAGKTTLGRRLAARLGLPFHHELGRELAASPRWRPEGVDASAPLAGFDAELFRRELLRDRGSRARIVETWHPGNLAYAAWRSPHLLPGLRERALQSIADRPVVVVPIRASRAVLAARQSEPGSQDFFVSVGLAAEQWAHDLGLKVTAPVWTDSATPDDCCDEICRRLTAAPQFPRLFPKAGD